MALFFLLCACAGPRLSAPLAPEQALSERLEAVLYRGAGPSQVGDLTVERAPGGAVRVLPSSRTAEAAREDTAMAADIRARLLQDPLLYTREVSVEVDGGVARLQGAVAGREQAARAVLTALDVRGVRAVESVLSWVPPRDLARLRSLHR